MDDCRIDTSCVWGRQSQRRCPANWTRWRTFLLRYYRKANSSVKRCRIVKDRIRLCKQGVRDLVMELCCALHNFRVRLAPWQPMI